MAYSFELVLFPKTVIVVVVTIIMLDLDVLLSDVWYEKMKGVKKMRIKIIKSNEPMKQSKLRVCAYVRVSTESGDQLESLQNQTESYTRRIKSNPEYELVGIYSDQGITGYSEKRPGFQKMLDDARIGKLDLIIVKSISRFARNTVTVLKAARELKESGVGIFFEEQNINTLSNEGEMMLSVMASFAQEESRSMSENMKWTFRKKFERGETVINTKRFMGYDKDSDGNLIINEKEAKTIKMIFELYIKGYGALRIAKKLNDESVVTVTGAKWSDNAVLNILKNEKYKGDYTLQKYYTPDNMRKATRLNRGEVQSYYIKHNHQAIVPADTWEKVQEIMIARRNKRRKVDYNSRYPLSGKLLCPYCGSTLKRRLTHHRRVEWWCSQYIIEGKDSCKGIKVIEDLIQTDEILKQVIVEEVFRNGKKHYRYTSKKKHTEF